VVSVRILYNIGKMDEYFKIVLSQQGREKLVVKGYLLVKDRNRDDLFHWNCEKKVLYKCKVRASTILIDGKHKLRTDNDHNHVPETSRAAVSIANSTLKGK